MFHTDFQGGLRFPFSIAIDFQSPYSSDSLNQFNRRLYRFGPRHQAQSNCEQRIASRKSNAGCCFVGTPRPLIGDGIPAKRHGRTFIREAAFLFVVHGPTNQLERHYSGQGRSVFAIGARKLNEGVNQQTMRPKKIILCVDDNEQNGRQTRNIPKSGAGSMMAAGVRQSDSWAA